MLSEREKEILKAIGAMGYDRLNPETFPKEEVDALIYKGLRALKEDKGEDDWTLVEKKLPKVNEDGLSDPILISIEGDSFPVIGVYKKDGKSSEFREGDIGQIELGEGLVVNAWKPLIRAYKRPCVQK